ncbi:hypothetical protein EVAR_3179_1 [Eumeta japonica]|uniref:Uncharacterized protein n=1 Tax=Eumeta variegata TaxID=151549 RepID=A0A4C1XJM3_EUMVA|nr:hypothetical protein EVAR_3179_1 [Eumeta japonica]
MMFATKRERKVELAATRSIPKTDKQMPKRGRVRHDTRRSLKIIVSLVSLTYAQRVHRGRTTIFPPEDIECCKVLDLFAEDRKPNTITMRRRERRARIAAHGVKTERLRRRRGGGLTFSRDDIDRNVESRAVHFIAYTQHSTPRTFYRSVATSLRAESVRISCSPNNTRLSLHHCGTISRGLKR